MKTEDYVISLSNLDNAATLQPHWDRLRALFSALDDAADAIEEDDESLTELIRSLADLVQSFLCQRRGMDVCKKNEPSFVDRDLHTAVTAMLGVLNLPAAGASNDLESPDNCAINRDDSIFGQRNGHASMTTSDSIAPRRRR